MVGSYLVVDNPIGRERIGGNVSTVNFQALTISSGDGVREIAETGDYRRLYKVRVQSDATGAQIRFDFHDSIHNESIGKRGMGPNELLWAFRCFVSDADAGTMSFSNFASDFGYSQDSYSARQIHKACKVSLAKFRKLYHVAREPGEVLEALTEMGIE